MENSFETTVATPSKWPGRDAPSQRSLTPRTDTVVAGGAGHDGYISLHRRDEHDVGAGLGAHEQVPLERPRVARHVLGVAELQRVHEDADRDHVALGAGAGDQGDVPVVQRAHGGHQPDRAPGRARPVERVAAAAGGLHHVHRRRPPYTAAGTTGSGASERASRVASAAPAW